MMKKTMILDTNVLLTDPNALFSFGTSDVVIPFTVLEELDKKKQNSDVIGANARHTIRLLDSYREKGSLSKGVRIEKRKGLLFIKDIVDTGTNKQTPDNRIISVALMVQAQKRLETNNAAYKVVVVSRDINVRVKCDSLDLIAIDFQVDKALEEKGQLYNGFATILVDDQVVERFYAGEEIYISKEEKKLLSNQFVMLISSANEKKTALARFTNYSVPLKKLKEYKNGIWGIKPKNKEQLFALDLLLDPKIQVVTLAGTSGTGKSLVALAGCIEQVMGQRLYKKLIVMRPVQTVGKDIGFLPGTKQEKLEPFLAPIMDSLQYLFQDDNMMLDEAVSRRIIEIEAIAFIRGRSIPNALILLDEAQNLTNHEIKTIATRLGEGSKLIVTGDLAQIDNLWVNSSTSGFCNLIEKFKGEEVFGHVTLTKGERSTVATLASKIL